MPHIHHLYWHIRCIQDLHDLTFIFIIQMKWSIEKVKYNSFMYLQFSHVPFSTRLLTCYVIKTKSCARWWMAIHLDTACFFYLVLLMIVSCWVLNHLTFRTLTPWWVEVEFLGHQAFWIYPFVGPPCGILWINHVFIVFLGTSIHISFSHEQCSLCCCWPKCEYIESSTDFSFQTQFLKFIWTSNNKIHSKIIIFTP